jgi:hypothetical protein
LTLELVGEATGRNVPVEVVTAAVPAPLDELEDDEPEEEELDDDEPEDEDELEDAMEAE